MVLPSATMTQPQPRFTINTPPEVEVGVFANFASIWQDDTLIVIDFATTSAVPQLGADDAGNPVIDVGCRTVARVRISPGQALELMRGLSSQLDTWEQGHGPVVPAPDSPEGL